MTYSDNTLDMLVQWAQESGTLMTGVKNRRTPDQGIGIYAARDIEPGESIIRVPVHLILSQDSIPQGVSEKLPAGMTLHGRLAAVLSLDQEAPGSLHPPWRAVLPTLSDLESCMALFWRQSLQDLLPSPARNILYKLQNKFRADLEMFALAFPEITSEIYLYSWCLVNSRSFYYKTSSTAHLPYHDRLALLPMADLLNHAPEGGCCATWTDEFYTITTERAYVAGEELCICYEEHTNDVLLAEYGFCLADNEHDDVCLDEVIIPRLDERRKDMLKNRGFPLEGFMLRSDSRTWAGDYRTQVALRLFICEWDVWGAFVAGGESGRVADDMYSEVLCEVLDEYANVIEGKMKAIQEMKDITPRQQSLLLGRWQQIRDLLISASH